MFTIERHRACCMTLAHRTSFYIWSVAPSIQYRWDGNRVTHTTFRVSDLAWVCTLILILKFVLYILSVYTYLMFKKTVTRYIDFWLQRKRISGVVPKDIIYVREPPQWLIFMKVGPEFGSVFSWRVWSGPRFFWHRSLALAYRYTKLLGQIRFE